MWSSCDSYIRAVAQIWTHTQCLKLGGIIGPSFGIGQLWKYVCIRVFAFILICMSRWWWESPVVSFGSPLTFPSSPTTGQATGGQCLRVSWTGACLLWGTGGGARGPGGGAGEGRVRGCRSTSVQAGQACNLEGYGRHAMATLSH